MGPFSVARSQNEVTVVVVVVEERAGLVEDKARTREVVGDSTMSDHDVAVAAAGRDRLAVGSAGMRGASMDVVVVGVGADWFATARVPWTRHWRAEEVRVASSLD
jgi:hypothetical protein